MSAHFANKIAMQNLLFSELSRMFGKEVPLYDKSLLVNKECNKVVCTLYGERYSGFNLKEEQLDKTSGERHGAIRIGRPDEYRLMTGFFAAFGMEPHNYYDMTNLGGKSQPIVATAFRSRLNPEHRVFCSLLKPEYFDAETRERIERELSRRQVFSEKAKRLVEKNEQQGGLSEEDAKELVSEGVNRIFKWTGQARNYQLYQDLSKAGFKIAADIACFDSHHLNHLTPNTLCLDLYTAAMKFCLAEISAEVFSERATAALTHLLQLADRYYLKIHFKHLSPEEIGSYRLNTVAPDFISKLVTTLASLFGQSAFALHKFKHAGFKDVTEGPPGDTPILLRQDAYKALTEPVTFVEEDGTKTESAHTARFGEIEQRFYATTPEGRILYDQCLAEAENLKAKRPELKTNFEAYQQAYAAAFSAFPKSLPELLTRKLVFGKFEATAKGGSAARAGTLSSADLWELVSQGFVRMEGIRYEDFLPFSAAGIFASNLGQYGTESTAFEKPVFTQGQLEQIMGREIVDPNLTYAAEQARSLLQTYQDLGILDRIASTEKEQLLAAIRSSPF